jgi:hypothetical protein
VTSKRVLEKDHFSLIAGLVALHSDLVLAVGVGMAPEWVVLEIECLLGDAEVFVELYDSSVG